MKKTRNTTAKSHVLQLLNESAVALSQPDIQEVSEGICDRVTIYRILERLIEEGEVHRTVGLDGVTRFAICTKCDHNKSHHHNHVHFSCEKCGEVKCLEKVMPLIQLPRGYKLHEANYAVSGICPRCN